jgi:putative peptidoglycan lipid II flippase
VATLTSVAKLAGAAKTIVLATFFGTSDALDAFLIAFLLPSFVADLVAGSLTGSLVPLLVRARTAQGITGAHRLASTAFTAALGIMLLAAGSLALSGRWLLPLAASSFPDEKLRLTTALFLALLCWLPMGACIAVWRAVLNSNQRFALAAIGPIASPLLCIVLLYALTHRWGIAVLCAGTVGGVAIEALTLGVAVWRLGYPVVPRWKGWGGAEISSLAGQQVPLLLSSAMTSACILVDQSFAGRLGPGQVSALVYGNRLTMVVTQVVAMPIGVAMLPTLARLAADQDWVRLRNTVAAYSAVLTLAAVPLAAGFIGASDFLVRTIFAHGAFRSDAVQLVAQVQRYSLLQIPFVLLLAIATRLTSALSANLLLVHMGIAALVTDVVLDFTLSRWFGVAGIALSAVFVQMTSLVGLTLLLSWREPRLFQRER